MNDETVAQKITSMQRCVAQAHKMLALAGSNFKTEAIYQDAAVVNIMRACETAIDLANMLIRKKRLGLPNESKESFGILMREKQIDFELGKRLQRMIGFRNLAVHQYTELNLDIVVAVIEKNLDDLIVFAEVVRPLLTAADR